MIGTVASAGIGADAPRRLVAVDARQLDVHQDQVGVLALGRRDAFGAVHRLDQLVAGAVSRSRRIWRLSSVSSMTRMRFVMPPPSVRSAAPPPRRFDADRQHDPERRALAEHRIRPRSCRPASRPCASRSRGRARCRPSCACWSCRPAGTRSKIRAWSSAAMPGPVSRTVSTKWPFSAAGADRDLALIGELDRVADEVEQHLRSAARVAGAGRQTRLRPRR